MTNIKGNVIKDSNNKLLEKYVVKKSNRIFNKGDSYSSLINHLRHIYSSMEEAFLLENEYSPVICCECNTRVAKFLSFYNGYNDICREESCHNEKVKRVNREIAKNRSKVGYDEYLLTHIDDIKKLVFNKVLFIDTFLNRTHKNLKEMKMCSESSMLDDRFKESKKCFSCGSVFEDYIYKGTDTCSKRCAKQKASFYANKSKQIIFKDKVEDERIFAISFIHMMESIDNLEFSKLCHNDKIDIFPKSLKNKYPYRYEMFQSFKNSNDGSFYDECLGLYCASHVFNRGNIRRNYTAYLLNYKNLLSDNELNTFYDEKQCSVCGQMVYKFNHFRITDTYEYINPHVSKYCYCSEQCYLNALSSKKNELYPITEEYRMKLSQSISKSIQSGEFTPKSNNRLTHWFKRDGINWRSSWEYAFYIHNMFNDVILQFEKIRIPYVYMDKTRTYIVDFVDCGRRILYEIGPLSIKSNQKDVAKQRAALNWCSQNSFEYIMIYETFFENLSIEEKYRIIDYVSDDNVLLNKLRKVLKFYE